MSACHARPRRSTLLTKLAENNALRLHPLPSQEISAPRIYEDLELPPAGHRDASRPYVLINMVSSLDGRTTAQGKAARIGSEADRQVMRTLRSKADAVMIGANTLRAERLSLGLDEFLSGSQPLAVVVAGTGDVPLETNLIAHERQEVLVIAAQDAPEDHMARLRSYAHVLRVPASPSGGVDLEEALESLKTERGVELLLVEGGPRLNHSLISEDLVDELLLTLAPKLLGGECPDALTLLTGRELSLLPTREPHLASVYLSSNELYLRYRLSRRES